MREAGESVISAHEIGRRFGSVQALKDIGIEISAGEMVCLVGPDGAGKTTFLQLMAAILDPTEGSCRVLGYDTRKESSEVTSRIGYMGQGFTLYERLTVAENLAFAAKVRGVPNEIYFSRRKSLLDMAGLAPFLDRQERALSGGMRKKLALCANLIHEPPLLLLDEPGLGVDPLSRRELWRMLEGFRSKGTTIVFSTSYMEDARFCDRVVFLHDGRMLALGSPEELKKKVEGQVFSLRTARPADAETTLHTVPGISGIQWKAEEIRFTLQPGCTLSSDLQARLSALGRLDRAEADMEDVFAVLREAKGDKKKAEPAAILTEALSGWKDREPGHIAGQELTRRFGDFVAVDKVSLKIESGEIFGLLGANGAGKTTLIRILCGLLLPSAGTATVAGIDVAASPRHLRQRIAYMSQRFSLYPDMTVGENFSFFASAYDLSQKQARAAIKWALAMTGLDGTEHESVASLSGAVRQRVALGCSILHKPSVLFLDEPTAGVDPLARFQFWRLIRMLAEAGTTVLVTTHYLDEALYCNRLGFMHNGRLIAEGDLAALRSHFPGQDMDTPEDVFIAFIEQEQRKAKSSEVRS